jgi:PHD/YefM family antitoxin component YafN of YafNO toxin-antitoxin module
MEQAKVPQSARQFLAIAQQDLKAARCLYREGCYPQAIFYLEQSVEKGLKSYSIASGIIDEKEAWREISHKTFKIYEKTTKIFKQRVVDAQENLKKIPNLEAFFRQRMSFPETIEQLDDTLEQIRLLSKHDEKALYLTKEELKKNIKTLQDLNREAKRDKAKARSKPITPSEFRASKRFIIDMLEAALADQPERLHQEKEEINRKFTFDTYEKLMKDVLSQFIPPVELFQSFFQISIILQPHAIARYPDSNFNPVEFYTPDLPLIESFVKLADITERALNQVDELYQKSEGSSS